MNKPSMMSRFPDLRTESDKNEALLIHRLLRNWPGVPGRDSSAAASALDCVAILVRSIYARVRVDLMPKPSDAENALVRYAWSLFDEQGEKLYGLRLRMARKHALLVIRPGLREESKVSFAELCRSDAMVEVLWKHPRFHLTHPCVIKGPNHPVEGSVFRDHDEISKDTLKWDGAKPETVELLVSNVTSVKHCTGDNTKLIYFNSPEVIQVDLTTGEGSSCRLADQWRFQAWTRVPGPADDENGLSTVEKGRLISYIVRAIVRHAAEGRGADSIRVFREDGGEQLPEGLVANNPMPDWGFKLGGTVPPGEKLSIFYTYYPDIENLPPPQECAEIIQMPENIRAPIIDAFKVFEDAENPPTRPEPPRARDTQQEPPQSKDNQQESVHPDRQKMIESFGYDTPPQTNRSGQNPQESREGDGPHDRLPHRPPHTGEGTNRIPRELYESLAPRRGTSRGRFRPSGRFSSSRRSRGDRGH